MISSSDEEPDDVQSVDYNNELLFFANELCLHPEILEKSQIPKMKKLKAESIAKVILKYKSMFGKEIDAKGMMKKVNNMKTRLKKKTDTKETGNKKILILEWEKKMLQALKCDSNPTIARIPGAMQFGVKRPNDSQSCQGEYSTSGTATTVCGAAETTDASMQKLPPRKKTPLDEFETKNTQNLTQRELQRLVLLQQLKTAEVQQQYFKEKLKNLETKKCNCKHDTITEYGNKCYYNL